MSRLLAWLISAVLTLSAAPLAAQERGFGEPPPPIDGRRIALVIGNSDYSAPGWSQLTNASRDAAFITERLRAARFEVELVANADWTTLTTRLDQFAARAASADVALIYYAGHGFEFDRTPYIVPVNGPDRAVDTEIEERFVNFNRLLQATRSRGLSLLFVDACRSRGPVLAIGGGPAGRVNAFGPGDSEALVFYSTSPSSVAYDAAPPGSPLSPFATYVGRGIESPGMDLGMMFTRVSYAVSEATRGSDSSHAAQVPHYGGSLTRTFYFTPPVRIDAGGGATTETLDIPLSMLSTIDESTLITRVLADHSPDAIARMARSGNPVALYLLGYMYEFGVGVGRDVVQARAWLERAAATGHPAGQLEYGYFLMNHGVPADRTRALALYRLAAAQNYAKAMSHLASAIWTSDETAGRRLLHSAAELGDANALYILAIQNERPASVAALQRLAAAGNVEGDRWLCELEEGEAAALLEHCRRAAEAQVINAQARLALMLNAGRGAPRDAAQARQWARLAVRRLELTDNLRRALATMLAGQTGG